MSIEELEQAVSQLPPDELAEFSAWFDVYRHQQEFDEWDRQMEADAKAGKLDWLAEELEEDIAAGERASCDALHDPPASGDTMTSFRTLSRSALIENLNSLRRTPITRPCTSSGWDATGQRGSVMPIGL